MKNNVSVMGMKKGEKGRILSISGGRGLQEKMDGMGIRPGIVIEKVSQQFLGGPVVIKAGSTQAGMGKGMASKIIVEVLK